MNDKKVEIRITDIDTNITTNGEVKLSQLESTSKIFNQDSLRILFNKILTENNKEIIIVKQNKLDESEMIDCIDYHYGSNHTWFANECDLVIQFYPNETKLFSTNPMGYQRRLIRKIKTLDELKAITNLFKA